MTNAEQEAEQIIARGFQRREADLAPRPVAQPTGYDAQQVEINRLMVRLEGAAWRAYASFGIGLVIGAAVGTVAILVITGRGS